MLSGDTKSTASCVLDVCACVRVCGTLGGGGRNSRKRKVWKNRYTQQNEVQRVLKHDRPNAVDSIRLF